MVDTRSRKHVREKDRSEKTARSVHDDAHHAVKEIHGYRLISKIGQGGMGAVFKARQNSLDREVALKILPPKIAADRSFIERFRNEARASAKLCHPNIVQGIDVGHDERSGLWYFSMEFIDGPSVKALIQKHGAIRESEALRIAGEVARALTAVNHAGMVHRDIKPDNILLTSAGEVKVADLGLTRDLMNDADMTSAGQAVGTPHYMSPEQVRGSKDVDIRADLYALGATLFHMVTGQYPFDDETSVDIMSKHLHAPPPHAREIKASVSEECERLIVKLMAKKREDRYQTPEKLVRDIDALLNPIRPARTSDPADETVSLEPPRKHPSRTRTPALLLASRTGMQTQSRSPLKPAAPAKGVAWYMYAALSIPFIILAAALLASSDSTHASPAVPATDNPELRREAPAIPASVASAGVETPAPPPLQPAMKHADAVTYLSPAFASVPAGTGVWWEAEDATQQDFVSHCWLGDQLDKRNLSGRKYLNHLNDAGWLKFQNHKLAESLHAAYTVDVPADGTYTLWVREYDPYSAAPWKFHWDDASWFSVPVNYPSENKVEIGKDRWLVWRKYPNQTLAKGKHTFRLEVDFDTKKIISGFDCFYLTTGAFQPNGIAKP